MSAVMALIALDGMIAGIESGSEIPVQLSELKMLKVLIDAYVRQAGAAVEAATTGEAVGALIYRGNTVSYRYDKGDTYGRVVSDCCKAVGDLCGLNVVDAIKAMRGERDELRALLAQAQLADASRQMVGADDVRDAARYRFLSGCRLTAEHDDSEFSCGHCPNIEYADENLSRAIDSAITSIGRVK